MSSTKKAVITVMGLVICFGAVGGILLWNNERTPMGMDEYLFYRLSSQAPNYNASKDWFYEDRPELLEGVNQWEGYDLDKALSASYDMPIYRHSPLPVYILSPFVKGLNFLADKGYIDHIEGSWTQDRVEDITRILRFFIIGLSLFAFWLIYKMVKSQIGYYAYFVFLPLFVCHLILSGTMYIYWDAFMLFFFVLTLYLMETKPEGKWQYLTACCLVNTKMYIGLLFLIPLVLKDKKIAFTALSIVPYWLATWWVTGEPLWVVSTYLEGAWTYPYVYTSVLPQNIPTFVFDTNLLFYVVMTVGGLVFWKRYPAYIAFWVLTIIVGFGLGMTMWTISALLYSGALIVPFVARKLGVFDFFRVVKAESK